jgi:two-component system, LytTR family, sensor kinase
MVQRVPVPHLALFGLATVLGVSSTIQVHLVETLEGMDRSPIVRLLGLNLTYWYVPVLLAPTIMAVALRYGLWRVPWPKQALVHVTGCALYSVVHTGVLLVARALLFPQGRPSSLAGLWKYTQMEYLGQLDWMLMSYFSLVGLAHALAYRRESEIRALDAARLETRLVQAQLQALQRQLHPHFLFNTLNTISGLMRTSVDAADVMIDRLGDLLRMTLDTSDTQQVSLKRELEVLRKYLEIEQTRFGPRLTVGIFAEPETLDAQVPNLLLQPLVENAVRHGIAPHARPGWISVHAKRDEARLLVEVRDSGDGVAPDRLKALNRGVGLGNTRARLEHLYPSAHQFAFANLDEGFCVTVDIPFETVQPAADLVSVGAA